jgi:hypothetical protein
MDVDPPPTIKVHRPQEKVQFGQNAFSGVSFGPKPPSKFTPVSVKRKIDATELAEDDIAHFKRVRLITSKERVRFVPGPFRQIQIAGKDLTLAAAEKYKVEESGAWEAFRMAQKTLGSSHANTITNLSNLARILRNVGKSQEAEGILQKTLKEETSTLMQKDPASLGLLMSNLMVALVAQKKVDAAEELWSSSTALFSAKASADETNSLIRAFELAHPFRRKSFIRSSYQPVLKKVWVDPNPQATFTPKRSPSPCTEELDPQSPSPDEVSHPPPILSKCLPLATPPAPGQEISYEELKYAEFLKDSDEKSSGQNSEQRPKSFVFGMYHYMTLQEPPSASTTMPSLSDEASQVPGDDAFDEEHDPGTYATSNSRKRKRYVDPTSTLDTDSDFEPVSAPNHQVPGLIPPPYIDMRTYIEPAAPATLDFYPSYFQPRTKGSPGQYMDVFSADDYSKECLHCPVRFTSAQGCEQHLAMYHPFVYMSWAIGHHLHNIYTSKQLDSTWLWLAWMQEESDSEVLRHVRIGWKCCNKLASTISEFSSMESCAHIHCPSSCIIMRLKDRLKMMEETVRLVPDFPYLQARSVSNERVCELWYCGASGTWEVKTGEVQEQESLSPQS